MKKKLFKLININDLLFFKQTDVVKNRLALIDFYFYFRVMID